MPDDASSASIVLCLLRSIVIDVAAEMHPKRIGNVKDKSVAGTDGVLA